MSKILVTGGAGFIGSNLVDELVGLGNQVVVVDDLTTGLKEYLNPKAVFYQKNIADDDLSEIFNDEAFEYVFHLAAQIDVRLSVENPRLDNKINVLGGLNVLDNCLRNKVKKIIFTSTGGAVYGDVEEVPTTENCLPEPISPYGIHKLTFEKYLNYYHRVYGQKYAAIRPANVYGPRQFKGGEAGVVSIFIDNAVNNRGSKLNGDGKQTRDFIFVGDLVRIFIKAMESDYVGAVNAGTGVETSLLEIIEAIEGALGRKIDIKNMPGRTGEQLRSCLDISRAEALFDWRPEVDLDSGIKRTIEWAKKRNK